MITIIKGSLNDVVVTLQERSLLDTKIYIFVVVRDLTNETIIFTATNISDNITRYDEFLIEEVAAGSVDFTDGKINLAPGAYTYQVYEAPIESPQDLDPDSYSPPLNLVEQSQLVCVGNPEENLPTYTDETIVLPTYVEPQ